MQFKIDSRRQHYITTESEWTKEVICKSASPEWEESRFRNCLTDLKSVFQRRVKLTKDSLLAILQAGMLNVCECLEIGYLDAWDVD